MFSLGNLALALVFYFLFIFSSFLFTGLGSGPSSPLPCGGEGGKDRKKNSNFTRLCLQFVGSHFSEKDHVRVCAPCAILRAEPGRFG